MARPSRIQYRGAVTHVTSRGHGRQKVFRDDRDRGRFLHILERTQQRYGWICHAYCLMDDHYHLVVETPRANLSIGMRQLNGVYTRSFNVRHHRRRVPLFRGRYKAIYVEMGKRFLEVCRHTALNPVRSGLVSRPDAWLWSSYRPMAGLTEPPGSLAMERVLDRFSGKRPQAMRRWREYVHAGIGQTGSPWDGVVGQVFLGSPSFIRRLERAGGGLDGEGRIPSRRTLKQLLAGGGTPDEIRAALAEGYRMAEMARTLGLHTSTISVRLKNHEQGNSHEH